MDFYEKEVLKVDPSYTCLAVVSLDSIFEAYNKYYLQVFLKECKYIEKKLIRYITDKLKNSDDSHEA